MLRAKSGSSISAYDDRTDHDNRSDGICIHCCTPSCGDHGTNTGAATKANPSPAGIFHGKTALAEFRPNHRYSALTLASLRHKWML